MISWVIPADARQPKPWRNGRGTSSWIYGTEGRDGSIGWEISIADLNQDADFSDYTGFDRIFTPLSGQVALAFDGGAFEDCPLLTPCAFRGETPTRCRVRAPGQALNVITDRSAHRGAVEVLHLADDAYVEAATGIFVVKGGLFCGRKRAGPGDTVTGRLSSLANGDTVVIRVQID